MWMQNTSKAIMTMNRTDNPVIEALIEYTGDKSGAEAPGPSGFSVSFKEFTYVFISELIK